MFVLCVALMGMPAFAASYTLRSVTVTPATARIAAGGTQQYMATGHYRNGTTKDLTATVSSSSSSSTVATASAGGMVKGVKAGSSSNCSTYCDGGFYTGCPTNNLYVGHSWIHDVGDTQFQSNINSVGNSNGSNWIIEYNYISRDHTGDQANGAHSEAFSSTLQNMVIRYNYFQGIISSGVITDASGGTPDVGPWYIYGNVVFWSNNAKMTSNSTASGLGA